MELLFFYIESNEIFKEPMPICFGGKYLFEYNSISEELNIKLNPFYLSNFFTLNSNNSSAQITNVTGIIGKNGAGKTSILSYLKTIFTRGHNGVRIPTIIALINDKKEQIIYHFSKFKITKGNYQDHQFKLIELKIKQEKVQSDSGMRFLTYSYPEIEETSKLDLIHFSNVFDGTQDFVFDGLSDISTNYLLRNDIKSNLENNLINPNSKQNEIEQYLFEEVNRQIDLVNGFETPNILPFPLPDDLIISAKRNYTEYSTTDQFQSRELDTDTKYFASKLAESFHINKRNSKKDNLSMIEQYFVTNCFINLIFEIHEIVSFIFSPDEISFLESIGKKRTPLSKIKEFLISKISSTKDKTKGNDRILKLLNGVQNFCEKIGTYIKKGANLESSIEVISIKTTNKQIFRDFYLLYKDSYLLRPYLNFNWRNLSSGEKALFNIYARFYSLANSSVAATNSRLKRNILILIDEGDLYLHPSWQKQFLLLMLKFLPAIYTKTDNNEIRNLQIVFTSNNPISASDLPNSNIIFLNKENGITTVIDGLDEKKLTFAANIHTLYADSFFLTSGLIGDFAKIKINEIIEVLQGKRENIFETKEQLETLISFIGEPLIRSKLYQMLKDRLQLNLGDLQDRIHILEVKLDKQK